MLKQIRPLETRDLDAAASAMQKAASRAYAYFGWGHSVARMKEFIIEDREAWTSVWVAEINGAVQGFMALDDHYIDQLFIAPEWSGRGLGSLLMTRAKTLYPSRLDLHCARQNFPGCRFYKSHGFVEVGQKINQEFGVGLIVYRWHGA